jgi:hypothetical protein
MLDGVYLNSLRTGNILKYVNGITIMIPQIISIAKRTRNDFHISLRKIDLELISYCSSGLGFFKKLINPCISDFFKMKIILLLLCYTNIEKCN